MPRSKKSRPKFGGLLIQPRIPGLTRTPAGTSMSPNLEEAIKREMARWGVSRSFVLATCASYALGVEDQPDYRKLSAERDGKKGNITSMRRKRA